MENTGVHQFQLYDAHGKPHNYVVTEHPAGEGMSLMYALLGLGAPAVLGLAGAALQSEEMLRAIVRAIGGGGLEASSGDTAALAKLVAGLDLASVGAQVERALATGRAPELTRQILSRTLRDARPLGGQSGMLDLAYQANYFEMLQAVWKVCAINRFFPVPAMSGSSAPANGAAPATSQLGG